MEDTTQDNLVEGDSVIAYGDLVNLVSGFQDQLAELNYRVSNKNFGSKLYQSKETIASKGRFIAGARDDVVIMDGQHPLWRLWAGTEDPATAPFRVDKDGNMVATSLTITGYIPTGGALTDIGTGNITGTYIASDAITTPKIAANAITATKISVSTLSAISADIGTVTAGNINGLTITGGIVQTSSTGLRCVMDSSDDKVKFMNSSTVYASLYPYAGGTNIGVILEAGGTALTLNDGTTFIYALLQSESAYVNVDGAGNSIDLVASSIDITGATNIEGNGNHLSINGNAFLRLKSMTGTTADALSGVQNGCMYYRSSSDDIRVRIGGVWKTVTAV